jgi:ligand-binding sensor domain-containing protein
MSFRLLVFFLVSFLLASHSIAQSPYFQTYYLARKGEPVQIHKVFQDSRGYMWFATGKGLFRFDGISQQLIDGTIEDQVTALAEDKSGKIWTGTRSGKLFSIETDLKPVLFDPQEGTAAAEISDILFDKRGNLWFSTHNDGLYYYTDGRIYRLDDADGMPDIFVYDIEEDAGGNIWAGTDGGAVICRLIDRKVSIDVLDYVDGLPDNIIKKVHRDGNNIILATEDAGVMIYNADNKSVTPLFPQWRYGSINDLCVDSDQVWMATGSGLVVLDRDISRATRIQQVPGMSAVTTVIKDLEGNVWAGSRSALVRCLNNYVQYIGLPPDQSSNVLAVAVDGDGIWYATDDGLFRRTERDDLPVVKQLLRGTRYEKRKVISLFVDNEGYLWCGFYGEGAIRINPKDQTIDDLGSKLRNGNVLNISGRGNDVWLATLDGAARVNKGNDGLTVQSFGKKEGLSADYIYQVFTDSKERVWFASDRQGVVMMNNGTFKHFSDEFGPRAVYGFAEDSNGGIWANVQLDGLYQLQGEKFVKIKSDQNVNCLSSSGRGRVVAVHDLGLELHRAGDSAVRRLGEEVGFAERKANLNAIARAPDGRIYIGTDHGIVVFTEFPEGLPSSPAPLISGLRAFNVVQPMTPGLELGYDENNITLNFLGIWFQNPSGLRFQYKLDGYDLDWISTQDRNAIFSSLPPGDYTFQVRVSDSEDFGTAKPVSFSFVINPPFWKTPVFFVLVAVAVVIAGYSYIRWRERSLTADKLMLEEKVRERTSEIQRKNEEIQTQAEEIKAINESLERRVHERTDELQRKNKALEEYAFINAHNLRSPVASILGLINLLSMAKLDRDGVELVNHMKTSAERLDNVVRTITESIEKGDQYDGFDEAGDDGID